jgi:hypothetical protein
MLTEKQKTDLIRDGKLTAEQISKLESNHIQYNTIKLTQTLIKERMENASLGSINRVLASDDNIQAMRAYQRLAQPRIRRSARRNRTRRRQGRSRSRTRRTQ